MIEKTAFRRKTSLRQPMQTVSDGAPCGDCGTALCGSADGHDNGAMAGSQGRKIAINRWRVGMCALLCLVTAGVLAVLYFQAESDENNFAAPLGAFVRVGLVLAALWFALPADRQINLSPKVVLIAFAALVGVVLRPRYVIPLLVLLAVLAVVFRPRDRNRRQKDLSAKYRDRSDDA